MSRLVSLGIVVLVFIALACNRKPESVRISSDDIDAPRPGSTPMEVMENVALAHATRDIDLYAEQLDPRFQLYFPFDPEGGEGSFDLAEEMETTGGMFADCKRIRYAVSCDPPRPSRVRGYPASEGFQEMMARKFDVSLEVPWSDDTIGAHDDSVLYVFAPHESDGVSRWRIVAQRTFTGGACAAPVPEE